MQYKNQFLLNILHNNKVLIDLYSTELIVLCVMKSCQTKINKQYFFHHLELLVKDKKLCSVNKDIISNRISNQFRVRYPIVYRNL